ncbi:LysR family transcriptional regulator [Pseudoflavonifractor phocaeensis]|uniref:LysR family transcriptional regulator n=1 Tax=Pseudoflavonifractor phocaeensis TaxID=1870988 RepID=UPI00210A210A|nr:LysR family transcriptional regulator [Pseudoflavonifractor phocaeensis]MCQ4863893.1 LysR family transcriptional regulator [Pseudoflavonifractor phocaeensis]
MRLEQLEYVTEIAKCHSMTRAAANLFVTQPALSESLNSLERELDFTIFRRSKQGMTLTAAGEKFYEEAQMVLSIIRGWDKFSQVGAEEGGNVNLGFTSVTRNLLPLIETAVENAGGDYHLCCFASGDDTVLADIQQGKFNVGLIGVIPAKYSEYAPFCEKNGWKLDFLFEDPFQVMISTKNPLAQKELLEFDDLKGLTIARYPDPYGSITKAYYRDFFAQDYPCYTHDKDILLEQVARDRAVAVFPWVSVVNHYRVRRGQVKPMSIRNFSLPVHFYIIHPGEEKLTAPERLLVEHIREIPFLERIQAGEE